MTIRSRVVEVDDETPTLIAEGGWSFVRILKGKPGDYYLGGPDVSAANGQAFYDGPVELRAETRASDDLYAIGAAWDATDPPGALSVLAVGYAP